MKKTFYTEWAYVLGVLFLAIGTAMMEAADFGVSMVVAPAYVLHRFLSLQSAFFTFGTTEYLFQGVLLIAMMLVLRRFRISYLFSFVTAVIYGFMLDGSMMLVALLPAQLAANLVVRILLFLIGMVFCAFGVSMMFHTYLYPAVYELFVKEVSTAWNARLTRFKTIYDCISCVAAVAMTLILFKGFVGVGIGTIFCALVNGYIIGRFSMLLEKHFTFRDGLPWRKFFSQPSRLSCP